MIQTIRLRGAYHKSWTNVRKRKIVVFGLYHSHILPISLMVLRIEMFRAEVSPKVLAVETYPPKKLGQALHVQCSKMEHDGTM